MPEDKKKGITSSAAFSIVTPNFQDNGEPMRNGDMDIKQITDPYTSSYVNPDTGDRTVHNNLPIRTGKTNISADQINNLFQGAKHL
jgi:hypothetical protein